uniref:Predicted nucleic acid-binding protein, contains PIN domain n=1 Tax=Candidatus Kentrum sp. LFY TaxID=2126342 RepID=A0A450WK97_9GAMM|nr:MAG: Predicted nucleic acid-binding protein, contains PIN domain [Candidatus Kentron sp. LFY]
MKYWPRSGRNGVKRSMTKRRTYIDANVWIAAVQSDGALLQRVWPVLQSDRKRLVISDFILLEVLPKPLFHRRTRQKRILEQLFSLTEKLTPDHETLLPQAIRLAGDYDLSPMDALHAATALQGQVDEFITLERPTKPLFRIPELHAHSLYSECE